jgi:hypothetical protein
MWGRESVREYGMILSASISSDVGKFAYKPHGILLLLTTNSQQLSVMVELQT